MKRHAGFTLIELLITITVIAILVVLSVVMLRSSEAGARDEKRKTDVAVIAQRLEMYHQTNPDDVSLQRDALPTVRLASTFPVQLAVGEGDPVYGSYPPTEYMDSEADIKNTLRDIDPRVLRAPGVSDSSPISLTVATSSAQPSPDIATYIYQPLQADGSLCEFFDQECRKFTIFYKLEGSADIQKVVSKHQ